MKNLLKKTAYILLSAAVFAFAACDTSVEDAPVIAHVEPAAKESENDSGKAYLSVSVNGNPARMISPTDITQAGISRTELLAKASGAESSSLVKTWQSDAERDAIAKMTGDTDILIDAGTYDFTLNLYAGKTLCQTGTLLDVAIAAGNNPLAFSTKYAENGKGSLSITLTWTESERVSSVKAGLFTVASLGEESADGYAFSEIAVTADEGSNYSATYAKDKVTNGAYFIRFELYATDGTKLNTLEDIVQIATACSTQKTIPLSNVNTLYAISYEKNGGDWAEDFTPTEKHNANTAVILPEEAHIAKQGYEFAGWYTSEDGGETLSENALLAVSAGTAADVAVYAKWTPAIVKYTVKHLLQNADADDYKEAEDDRETLYGKTESETVAVAKEYEHFTAKDIAQTAILPDGSTIVEIKYDREVFTVTYFNGGTEIASQSVRYEGKASELDAPADSSRNFAGWYISTDSGATLSDTPFNFADGIVENVALYAIWGVVADASNVAEKIASMTKSNTVIVKGSISNDTLTAIRDAINKKNFGIEIDLSEATGLTSIGTNAFNNCTRLTSITIPSSVTSISSFAFYNCSGLLSVTIPDSVTSISSSAFYNCSGLTSVAIGDGVTSIGMDAFYGCSGLTSVTIPSSVTSIGDSAFYNCSGLTSVTIGDGVTSIGMFAFYGCSGLLSVTIPDSVTSIGDCAFNNCSGLTSVAIGDGVTSMGWDAFYGCSGLTEMTIPFVGASADATGINALFGYIFGASSYTGGTATNMYYSSGSYTRYYIPSALRTVKVTGGELKYGAFYNCSGLTSVTIGDGVTSIEGSAFYGCSGLTEMTIPFVGASADATGSNALFGYIFGTSSYTGGTATDMRDSYVSYSYTTYYIPSALRTVKVTGGELKYGAFYVCEGLTSVTIGDGVTRIGERAFYNCSGLTSVTIGDGVTSIEDSAFRGCSGLKSVTIGDGVTSISSFAFYECRGLTSVTIPSSVTSIGDRAFYNCSGLTSVTIGDGVTSIRREAFYGCSGLLSVTIPDSVTSIGDCAFNNCSGLTSVAIGDGVTSIEGSAFYGCSGLTEMTIPFVGASADATDSNALFGYIFGESSYTGGTATNMYYSSGSYTTYYIPSALRTVKVTGGELKFGAFYNCRGLTSVTIGDGVTSIEGSAFYGCSRLLSVAIGDGVTSIGTNAFNNCTRLTSITIPSSVTSIGMYAFRECSWLTSVAIPDSVTSIGEAAFYNCSGLESITFGGTVVQWNAISKGIRWKSNVPATKVVCSDGSVKL